MMTRADIFVRVLSEVSGKPRQKVADHLADFRKTHPGGTWDQMLQDNEAETLLANLRIQAPALMEWLINGGRSAGYDDEIA